MVGENETVPFSARTVPLSKKIWITPKAEDAQNPITKRIFDAQVLPAGYRESPRRLRQSRPIPPSNPSYPELPSSAFTGAPPTMAVDTSRPPGPPGMELPEGDSPIFTAQKSGQSPLPHRASGPWAPPGIRQPWPEDEYLRDGGDRGWPAGVTQDWVVHGLEMEDAVAHFDTLDGRRIVIPSNEVYLYSPCFAAVRKVVNLVANEQTEGIETVHYNDALLSPQLDQSAGTTQQNLQAVSQIAALPAHAFLMKQGDGAVSSALGPKGFQDGFQPYENLAVIRQGVMEMAEMAQLAQGVAAAVAWEHTQAVQIILDRRGPAALVKDEKTHAHYTALPPGNPRLRIIKIASTPTALPGEEVWFTLRFDNVGNQVIGNVTVIDSLNTRLQYVEGSAQCSRAAELFTEPNEGGSLVLRCEIADPLEPGQGGILRFRCTVR
jgi:uncharacterized repeat protein (TIGR01451 family)